MNKKIWEIVFLIICAVIIGPWVLMFCVASALAGWALLIAVVQRFIM